MDRKLHQHFINYLSLVSTIKRTASSTTVWSTGVSSVAISRSVMYTTGTTKTAAPQPVSGRPW